jgi:hypothetical protein
MQKYVNEGWILSFNFSVNSRYKEKYHLTKLTPQQRNYTGLKIVIVLTETLRLMQEIDRTIPDLPLE